MMQKVLSIAGSDCSGGAGIQADLKTMTSLEVYGMSVITALTAQNTQGVNAILEVSPDFVKEQISAIFNDIRPNAIKIGMVSNPEIIHAIVDKLKEYHAYNIIIDPVMVATSGAKLINDQAYEALTTKLFPLASLITPNIYESEILLNRKIETLEDMQEAAKELNYKFNVPVLVKGGHILDKCSDIYYDGTMHYLKGEYVDNKNAHGTGCTLSSAIASYVALGYPMLEAITKAKEYLTTCLKAQLDLGLGSGPLNHMANHQTK